MNKYCKTMVLLLLVFAVFAVFAIESESTTAYADDFAIGSYVTFGTYPQTAEGNDNTPIEWLVLDRDGDKALLLSRYALDAQPYNEVWEDITWEKCTLRRWLNGSFMKRAFTDKEQTAILLTNVDNSDGQGFDFTTVSSGYAEKVTGGNDTQDKIFLLSYAEANKYLGVTYYDYDNTQSRVAPTAYVLAQGVWPSVSDKTADGEAAEYWWLRSPGLRQSGASCVYSEGSLDGGFVNSGGVCIRPALWVDVSAISGTTVSEPTATPNVTPIETPAESHETDASEFAVGNYVTLGTYPQTAEGTDNTPIEWLVLDRDGDKALLFSSYGLDAQPYNEEQENVTWENCTLRTWLNDDFINRAFTAEEQAAILLTDVDNSSSQNDYNMDGGNNTQDELFLLSYAEINKYFDSGFCVAPTAYALEKGVLTESDYKTKNGESATWWWLRSPGEEPGVNKCGICIEFCEGQGQVSIDDYFCVCPAMWVDFSMISGTAVAEPTATPTVTPTATPTATPTIAPTAIPTEESPAVSTGDSEESLRAILKNECGSDDFYLFAYGDYDGDGTFEAFALVGGSNDWGGLTGDIWFVSSLRVKRLQSGKSYCLVEQLGDTAPILFTAEESYGGSGSISYLWCVKNGIPTAMDVGILSGFTYSGSGNEYYAYPDAFDAMDDGTGHTWKQYYFYLEPDTLQMREYGGIYIERSDLERYANASAALLNAEAEGYEIREIIYRANGIVNVNLHRAYGYNSFLTFRLNGNEAIDITPADNSGYYLLASSSGIAVYPSGIGSHTSVQAATQSNARSDTQTNTQTSVRTGIQISAADGKIFKCDIDGDGSEEQIQLTYIYDDDNGYAYGSYAYYINIADANGNIIAQQDLFTSSATSEYFTHYFTISKLNDCIYIEAHVSYEGIATHYIILKYVNGSYKLTKHIYDPDPSDGTEVRDELTSEDWYESEELRDFDAIISALEKAFSEYDLRFRKASDGYVITAIIPDEDVICVLYDSDIVKHSESATAVAQEMGMESEEETSFESVSATPTTFMATADVNMRSNPNKSSSIITTVKKGNTGTYLGESSTDSRGVAWYKVQYNGKTGWVSSTYAVLQGDTSAQGRFTVSGGNTNIRSQPNLNGEVLGSIRAGNSGEYLGKTSTDSRGVDWYKIRYNGVTGWVSSKYTYLH